MVSNKNSLPVRLVIIVAISQLWALWREIPMMDRVFQLSVIALFFSYIITKVSVVSAGPVGKDVELCTISISCWCLMMFLAYQFVSPSKTVNFLFIPIDSKAVLMVYIFLMIIPGLWVYSFGYLKWNRVLGIIGAVIVATSIFFSIRAILVNPNAMRARAMMEFTGQAELLYGTPDYSIVYSFALLIPVFLSKMYLQQGKNRLLWTLGTVCVSIIIVVSQFATALLVALLVLICFYLFKNQNKSLNIIAVAFAAILFFLFAGSLSQILLTLAAVIPGDWQDKLIELAAFFSGEATGDIVGRSELYAASLEPFFSNPIFGMLGGAAGSLGDHSTLMDTLGATGIVGTIAFIMGMYYAYKNAISMMSHRVNIAAFQASTIGFIALAVLKNTVSSIAIEFTFFSLVPLLILESENVYEFD